jgi:hypothetical protein
MELQYEKAMKENGLEYNDLNEEAKVGIIEINKSLRAISLKGENGKPPSKTTVNKIKTMDKWVYYEILDMLQDTDNNEDEIPYDSEDVIEEIEEERNNYMEDEKEEVEEKVNKPKQMEQPKGDANKINFELENLFKNNKLEVTINEIKSLAPNIYNILFEIYEKGEENGVETSQYRLVEFEEQKYKLTKI